MEKDFTLLSAPFSFIDMMINSGPVGPSQIFSEAPVVPQFSLILRFPKPTVS